MNFVSFLASLVETSPFCVTVCCPFWLGLTIQPMPFHLSGVGLKAQKIASFSPASLLSIYPPWVPRPHSSRQWCTEWAPQSPEDGRNEYWGGWVASEPGWTEEDGEQENEREGWYLLWWCVCLCTLSHSVCNRVALLPTLPNGKTETEKCGDLF